jgi:hypothetical protein
MAPSVANSMDTSVYTLNAKGSVAEDDRLDRQHWLIKAVAGGSLLPADILSSLQSLQAPAIADVGTGTGIWLKDLAEQLPQDAQLDGYDFDVSKFPPPSSLPRNVKLGFGNVLEPFPEAIRGRYDVVHARFLVFALKSEQWKVAAGHLRSLLKPGGWLLWEETGYIGMQMLPMSSSLFEWTTAEAIFASSVGRDIRYGRRASIPRQSAYADHSQGSRWPEEAG